LLWTFFNSFLNNWSRTSFWTNDMKISPRMNRKKIFLLTFFFFTFYLLVLILLDEWFYWKQVHLKTNKVNGKWTMIQKTKELKFLLIDLNKQLINEWIEKIERSYLPREGNPGHHEPPLCRHEPPRFAKQIEPPLCSNEHEQSIKMCLCVTGSFFKHVF